MELIRGLHNIRPRHRDCVLTIGNFDGVHLGHQAVLQRVKESAAALNVPAAVMIFEPQPLELFRPDQAPARISQWREKYEVMSQLGLEYLICARFNAQFSQQPARQFIEDVLVDKLGVRHLVVGDDFRFGRNREGDFALLQAAGDELGFAVSDTASFRQSATRVSSTLIREALARGQFEQAEAMLGHPFYLSGRVVHGEKKGRTIGFPTANIPLRRTHCPLHGVYAVTVSDDEHEWLGVANIGRRPTLGGNKVQLEVHLFDYQGDLYGRHLHVIPHMHLRDEHQFASFADLQQQIEKDVHTARAYFAAVKSEFGTNTTNGQHV
ncbi:MAG: bifunctional riboflavin kinase/FAD synthetase [Idiomarina sp.]|nr:bifunctional riboflavin kinase/FAD synthetase [Idiomarina sp.]